jgi:hypothetical protein
LEAEFVAAVKDYIDTCKMIGKEPQKPFKGSFNIRIHPELHRIAVLEAYKEGISLNELASRAIDNYVNKGKQAIDLEHKGRHHDDGGQEKKIGTFTESFNEQKEYPWTVSSAIISK